jgi:guanylate kinase
MMPNENTQRGLIVVAAPSGAGKSTLCTHLLKDLGERLSLSISCTSRAPRGTEKHGQEYFFMSRDEFAKKIDEGEFAEWALVHGNYYGTSRRTIESFWSHGKHVLLDIDVQGAELLRKAYPKECFTIFIAPPSIEELERRLRGRATESEEAIQKRMANALAELQEQHRFSLVLVNDEYEQAYEKLAAAVLKFMDEREGQ